MVLYSGKLVDWNSAFDSDIQDKAITSGIGRFPSAFNAPCTMAVFKRAAARAAWKAVAGPCITEYGPCTPGKKKIVRTLRTASTISSHPLRPEIIEV